MRLVLILTVVCGLAALSFTTGCENKPKAPEVANTPAPQTPEDTAALPESPTPPGPGAVAPVAPLGPTGNNATGGGRSYTVKPHDGLMAIARTQLGNASRWKEIASLNDLQPPYGLKVGQVLRMPAK